MPDMCSSLGLWRRHLALMTRLLISQQASGVCCTEQKKEEEEVEEEKGGGRVHVIIRAPACIWMHTARPGHCDDHGSRGSEAGWCYCGCFFFLRSQAQGRLTGLRDGCSNPRLSNSGRRDGNTRQSGSQRFQRDNRLTKQNRPKLLVSHNQQLNGVDHMGEEKMCQGLISLMAC
ncbi:unnamed protein product [Gadus morhua 'NCC']